MQPNNNMANSTAPAPAPMTTPMNPGGDVVFKDKPKKNKGMIIGMIILAFLAAGGIGFGVWAYLSGNQKISDLNNQISDLQNQLADNETVNIDETDIEIGNYKNPIITAESPKYYNINFTSPRLAYGDKGQFSLSLTVRDGAVSYCEINSIESKWIDDYGGGTLDKTTKLKDCNITGINGKIFKVVEVGEGQDALYDSVAFIMENGEVQYLSLNDALEKGDFAIRGKMDIDGYVTDAFAIGVGEDGASAGGYGSTVFILNDGSFVKYDESML